ncbi:hypothetical protein ABHV46_10720 [Asaia sp. BMEF1]|uniref:glycine-rich domain-containing protein n=1 Tax=Asaia sp. BMEF1 TaxID=3155932 RepID=UPI003F672478
MKKTDFAAMFPEPWGASADAQYMQFPVPSSTTATGRASLDLGFPPSTMTPPEAGGSYPFGADVNGGFRMCSTSARNYEAGVIPPYSQVYAQEIGGYPLGARVADATTLGAFWISTADDNLTTPGVSGASWVTLASTFSGRFIQKFLLTSSGTYTPSATAKKILVRVIGAGGSGAGAAANPTGSNAANCGGAGAGGAYVEFLIDLGVLPGPFTVNIGMGGVGTTGTGAPGGATSFGTASANLVICNGGGGGASTGSVASGQTGFANQSSGGTPVVNQTPGLTGIIALPGQNGMSPFVAAGALLPPVGPASQMGVGGGNGSTGGPSIVCQPAIGYGAASGGGASSGAGTATAGNGAQGVVEITEYT